MDEEQSGGDDSAGSVEPAGSTDAGPRGGLAEFWSNPAYRFVVFFLPYLAIAAFSYPWLARRFHGSIQAAIVGTAQLLHGVFELFTDKISGSDKLLVYDGFLVTIVDECTGIYEAIIFTAAVLAFPSGVGQKLIGIALGNLIIYAFNIVRIMMLILVGRYHPDVFEFMHIYFWQATMILMIASVWLLWLVKVVHRAKPAGSAGT